MNAATLERAREVLDGARSEGADSADVLLVEGSDFSVTVRQGDVETLTEAGSKALGLRVFVGQRTATVHTSDFSAAALRSLARAAVELARATSADPAAGLPDATPPPEPVELGLHDPSVPALPTSERIDWGWS